MKNKVSISSCPVLRCWLAICLLALAGGGFHSVRAANSQVKLLSNSTSTRAIALETITMRAEPFGLTTPVRFGPDNRTRITLYGMDIGLLPGEGASAFSADMESLESGQRRFYQGLVEYVGQVPPQDLGQSVTPYHWLYQIVIRLPDNLPANVGDVLVRVNWRGNGSNRVRVAIGTTGGGPADDAGSVPTPAPAVAPAPTPAPTPDQFAAGTIIYADAKRFLEQATFGPTDTEITRVRAMGYQAWLNEQFAKPAQPYPDLDTNVSTDQNVTCPTTLPAADLAICRRDKYTSYPLAKFFLQRALYGDDQLRQRAAWAMHKINIVSQRDINVTHWMQYYLRMLDNNAFGNYRQLLFDLSLNMGMGDYLDSLTSTKLAPNENYAREVLQLFSINTIKLNQDGTPQLGPDGMPLATYDQNVVNGFTKVFTGFNRPTQRFAGILNYIDPMVFNQGNHDLTAKTLLDGFTLPANQTGLQDVNGALDNIYSNSTIAPYISKELIHMFVTSNPSPSYVKRVVDAFNNNCNGLYPSSPCISARGDLKAVYRAILLDPEARGDVKSSPKYGRLREPVELFTNVARVFNATAFNTTGQSDGVIVPLMGANERGSLGSLTYTTSTTPNNVTQFNPQDMATEQDIYRPLTVFSYYSSDFAAPGTPGGTLGPEFGIYASATALKRTNLLNMLIFNGIEASPAADLTIGTPNGTKLSFAAYTGLAGNPTQLIDALNQALMHNTLPASVKASINTAVTAVPVADSAKRVQTAVYLIVSSSLYQVEK